MSDDLKEKQCKPCEGGVAPLSADDIKELLSQAAGWKVEDNCIYRVFEFKNYYRTMAFVNAIAWMAHRENHHPDMLVAYNHCRVEYTTHAIGGLSENDFICAVKVNRLLD